MSKIEFISHRFSQEGKRLILLSNTILDEYRNKGYKLTLRQLYYQLVARGYIENSTKSYDKVGVTISDARLAGEIDWDMIEDRGREVISLNHWSSPSAIIYSSSKWFRLDKWENQPNYCEVMVEKDALSGIILPVCHKYDVKFSANKGYSSSSAMYEAGQRFIQESINEKELFLFYLGDHDPSGIDMTRDIQERMELFSLNSHIKVHRLALNMDQIEIWQPPENPAKEQDTRYQSYREKFGDFSWELDAVKPEDLEELIEKNIKKLIVEKKWQETIEKENEMKRRLEIIADKERNI